MKIVNTAIKCLEENYKFLAQYLKYETNFLQNLLFGLRKPIKLHRPVALVIYCLFLIQLSYYLQKPQIYKIFYYYCVKASLYRVGIIFKFAERQNLEKYHNKKYKKIADPG